jgi:hypothetical protein
LEHASNVAFEYQKNANKYQEAIRQSSMHLDEEQKTKAIARETLANADRRAHTLQNALEESRTMLEQADRARRAAEQELQVHCTHWDFLPKFLSLHYRRACGHVDVGTCSHQVLTATLTLSQPGG